MDEGHHNRQCHSAPRPAYRQLVTAATQKERSILNHSRGSSAENEIAVMVGRLDSDLGESLVAFITGVDEETVSAWAAGEILPPAEARHALRFTLRAFSIVAEADSAAVARAWFVGTNPGLGDTSPAEALEAGHFDQVIAAAQSHAHTG